MDNIYNSINEFYTKLGFLEKYGKDVFVATIIILVFLIVFSYFHVMNRIEPIRANWVKERCNPSVMPFAGIINAPPGVNKMTYTTENFNGCVNNILASIVQYALAPIYYVVNIIRSVFLILVEAIQQIRTMIDKIRTSISDISKDIYGRSLNITVPIIDLMINVRDMLGKTQGVLAASIFSLFGGYLTMKSVITTVVQTIFNILVALIALIVFFWIIPFTWGVAAVTTVIATAIAIPLGIISISAKNIFHIPVKGIPKIPRCFDENTDIILQDKSIKKIKDLQIGDILLDGSKITGLMESSTDDHTFYNLNNIIVTGTHRVYHENEGWILVREHPESKLILKYDKPLMYCVGTDSKLFTINDTIFGDWDELDNNDIVELYKNATHTLPSYFMRAHIHKYLDGGFVAGTKIELKNGKQVNIEDVKVNDILKNGEKVVTMVKLDAKELVGVYEYCLSDKVITGGPNLEIVDKHLGAIDTTKINGIKIKSPSYIYNLVTDMGTFYVNDIRFSDYNSTTDKYLKDRKRDFKVPDLNIYDY